MPRLERFSLSDPARRNPCAMFECANESCELCGWKWPVPGSHDSGVFEPDVEADCACPECQEEGRIA